MVDVVEHVREHVDVAQLGHLVPHREQPACRGLGLLGNVAAGPARGEHLVARAQEVVEPDRAVGAGDLVPQVHAAAEGPADLELADCARLEPDQRDRVVLVVDGVHERVRGAHDLDRPVPLADEVADDLDAVAAEVDDGAAAGEPAVPEPGAVGARMRLAGADPGHVTQGTVLDGLDRLEGLGRVAQVLEIAAEHPGLLDGLEHPPGLVGGSAKGLRAQDGLAGRGHRLDGLLVEVVRERDHDDVRLGVADRRLHVRRERRDAPAVAERLAPGLAPRIHDPHPVPATLPVEGHRVEVPDEAGAEHRDRVVLHVRSLLWVVAPDSRFHHGRAEAHGVAWGAPGVGPAGSGTGFRAGVRRPRPGRVVSGSGWVGDQRRIRGSRRQPARRPPGPRW